MSVTDEKRAYEVLTWQRENKASSAATAKHFGCSKNSMTKWSKLNYEELYKKFGAIKDMGRLSDSKNKTKVLGHINKNVLDASAKIVSVNNTSLEILDIWVKQKLKQCIDAGTFGELQTRDLDRVIRICQLTAPYSLPTVSASKEGDNPTESALENFRKILEQNKSDILPQKRLN